VTGQTHRLPRGGRIDRARPLRFRFDGRAYDGYAGDTLASALLANGVTLVGRSFKYHRPRGLMAAGAEEPNAIVQLGAGPRTEPNLRATQVELFDGLEAASVNRWPSLKIDFGTVNGLLSRFLPAGFYYKTFMWPKSFWEKVYEPIIRRAAGLGAASRQADPDRYEKVYGHCEVLVIGSGPAGLMAALSAARSGARVIVADESSRLGGSLLGERGRHVICLAEEHLVGRLAVEGAVRHDSVVLVDVEVDEACERCERVEALLEERKPCFMDRQKASIMELLKETCPWAMSCRIPASSRARSTSGPLFSVPSSAKRIALPRSVSASNARRKSVAVSEPS